MSLGKETGYLPMISNLCLCTTDVLGQHFFNVDFAIKIPKVVLLFLRYHHERRYLQVSVLSCKEYGKNLSVLYIS